MKKLRRMPSRPIFIKIPSGLIFVMGLVVVEMIAVIVISIMHHTIMACLSYFISVLIMLYILYLLLNKPIELAESDTTICYFSNYQPKYHTIYRNVEAVPQDVREGGYTFFCRGSGADSHHLYMYSPDVSFPSIVYLFSTYYCRMKPDNGAWKRIFIYSKGDGVDRTTQNITKSVFFGTIFAIITGIMVLFYTNIKYQPEFQKFYDNNVDYFQEIDTNQTLESNILYNLNFPDGSDVVLKHFKDCDFTLVLCEDNQGGYLFLKCICINRAKYSVNIVNLNPYVGIGDENLETKLKSLGNDYQAIVTLMEDTFKMRFQHFAVLKYDEFSNLLTGDTMQFTPPQNFVNAVHHWNQNPEETTSIEKSLAEYYLSTGLSTEKTAYSYSGYIAQIMNAEEICLNHIRKNGKYQQTMESFVYQMENDLILSVLQNIAEKNISANAGMKCIETNMSWDFVSDLLMLSTYKNKSLYHSYYNSNNTVSIPYTSGCMWYESDTAFNLYVSQNDIDSLAIKWLYYTVGR